MGRCFLIGEGGLIFLGLEGHRQTASLEQLKVSFRQLNGSGSRRLPPFSTLCSAQPQCVTTRAASAISPLTSLSQA